MMVGPKRQFRPPIRKIPKLHPSFQRNQRPKLPVLFGNLYRTRMRPIQRSKAMVQPRPNPIFQPKLQLKPQPMLQPQLKPQPMLQPQLKPQPQLVLQPQQPTEINSRSIQSLPIYLGENVHAYTHQVNQVLQDSQFAFLRQACQESDFYSALSEMEHQLGHTVAYSNFKQVFRHGFIVDPELPNINVALLLITVWEKIKTIHDPTTYRHFRETLDQIGMTCIQGISHRLFIDFTAFCT